MTDRYASVIIRRSSPRLLLSLLQVLFAFILAYRFPSLDVLHRADTSLFVMISVSLLLILCLRGPVLVGKPFVSLLTLVNTGILILKTYQAGTIEPWMYFEYILVILMASVSSSARHLWGLGGVVSAAYGLSAYAVEATLAEHALLIPVLLSTALLCGNKTEIARTEFKRIVESEEQARYDTMSDPLTGLPNRAQFIERVWRSIECAKNNREFQFAIIFIDLDGFKPINDGLGHKAGDTVLIKTAKRLQACLRKGDVVARYGGDEFTLLINNVTGKTDAIRVAERVLRKLTEPIDVGKIVHVGASIGIALSSNVHARPEDLIRDADLAMYRAKSQGKGRYEISDQIRDTKVGHAGGRPAEQILMPLR
ncbi:MAG TPA: GGDEF domain-containing protein [Nitrospiraceae bacterium]|jgi:diguanylate cyclase (GGDEF)-like protein|nr:GGDEF domain-containing protein [Nitrospiraceae bacterium]